MKIHWRCCSVIQTPETLQSLSQIHSTHMKQFVSREWTNCWTSLWVEDKYPRCLRNPEGPWSCEGLVRILWSTWTENNKVKQRWLPVGYLDTKLNIWSGSDPEPFSDSELRDDFVTCGIKKVISLHSCWSAWLQQWSRADLQVLFCSVLLTGAGGELDFTSWT